MNMRIISLEPLSVRELSPPDLITVASQAGFKHVSLRLLPPSSDHIAYPVIGDTDMRADVIQRLNDTGIGVLNIEVVRLQQNVDLQKLHPLLETGAMLGAKFVVAVAEDPDPVSLRDHFSELCEMAANYKIVVALEFIPWTTVRSLKEALNVVKLCGCGQIMVDALHLDRAGEDSNDLATVVPGLLASFQICDAPIERPLDQTTLLRQAREDRLLPGSGGLKLGAMLASLPKDLPIGIEVPMSGPLGQLPAVDRAKLLLSITQTLLRNVNCQQ